MTVQVDKELWIKKLTPEQNAWELFKIPVEMKS